jgi:hypothetical protein
MELQIKYSRKYVPLIDWRRWQSTPYLPSRCRDIPILTCSSPPWLGCTASRTKMEVSLTDWMLP